jgi:hypothetical protein
MRHLSKDQLYVFENLHLVKPVTNGTRRTRYTLDGVDCSRLVASLVLKELARRTSDGVVQTATR